MLDRTTIDPPTPKVKIWTDDKNTQLKELWGEGLSCSLIAATLGPEFTRNSVISKIHRMGFGGRVYKNKPWAERVKSRKGEGGYVAKFNAAARARKKLKSTPDRRSGPQQFAERAWRTAPDLDAFNSAIPVEQRVGLLDLDDTKCHFPVGDPCTSDFFFCGAFKPDEVSYCGFHDMICHAPPASRRRPVPA